MIVHTVYTPRPFRPYNPPGMVMSGLTNVHSKIFVAFGPESAWDRAIAENVARTPYSITDPDRLREELRKVRREAGRTRDRGAQPWHVRGRGPGLRWHRRGASHPRGGSTQRALRSAGENGLWSGGNGRSGPPIPGAGLQAGGLLARQPRRSQSCGPAVFHPLISASHSTWILTKPSPSRGAYRCPPSSCSICRRDPPRVKLSRPPAILRPRWKPDSWLSPTPRG